MESSQHTPPIAGHTETRALGQRRPRFFCYIRFSSKPQEDGDSERRQLEKGMNRAAELGAEFVDAYANRGLSGWTGKNRGGDLGRMIEDVEAGKILPGDIIWVENHDRLTRRPPLEAIERFIRFLNAGIALDINGYSRTKEILNQQSGLGLLVQDLIEMFRSTSLLSNRGFDFGQHYSPKSETRELSHQELKHDNNPLEQFFDSRTAGRGIWKWRHYFEIYHRHFSKFVGSEVNLLEIGVFSGGSLDLWRYYFGERCQIYGVDIEEICKMYEGERTHILIGDQGDRAFWANFRTKVPNLDIVIDDGGHQPNQQIVTLEEILPHINPGGIYLCEDIHGAENDFYDYCQGLIRNLNDANWLPENGVQANSLQRWIKGVYFYPFVTVIEKTEKPVEKLLSLKHGTVWQPFKTGGR